MQVNLNWFTQEFNSSKINTTGSATKKTTNNELKYYLCDVVIKK